MLAGVHLVLAGVESGVTRVHVFAGIPVLSMVPGVTRVTGVPRVYMVSRIYMVVGVHVMLPGVQAMVTGVVVFPHVSGVHVVLSRVPQVVSVVPVVPMVQVVATVAGALVHVVVAAGRLAGVHGLAVGHVGVWGEVGGAKRWQRGVGIMGGAGGEAWSRGG